jgi:hypothetical protein
MHDGGGPARGPDWLGRTAAVALVVVAAAAVTAAVRLGAASTATGGDLLARLRAGTEQRVASERAQIRPALDAAASGKFDAALRQAEAALPGLEGNSQLHLFLAGQYRAAGRPGPALREYRRAVELVRDYAERRSPEFIGAELDPWLRRVRPAVSSADLGDLNFLTRALAGGCS